MELRIVSRSGARSTEIAASRALSQPHESDAIAARDDSLVVTQPEQPVRGGHVEQPPAPRDGIILGAHRPLRGHWVDVRRLAARCCRRDRDPAVVADRRPEVLRVWSHGPQAELELAQRLQIALAPVCERVPLPAAAPVRFEAAGGDRRSCSSSRRPHLKQIVGSEGMSLTAWQSGQRAWYSRPAPSVMTNPRPPHGPPP